MSESLFIFVIALVAMSPIAAFVVRLTGDRAPYLLSIVPAAMAVFLVLSWQDVSGGETFTYSFEWIAALDVTASWRLDGLAITFALLVLGIGALVLIYAGAYMKGEKGNEKFYAFLFLFMAAMLGVALADNVIVLFVFWELTSISSFMLIGHKHSYSDSRASALQALVVTGSGGLALLGGLVGLGLAADSWQISEIITRADVIADSPLAIPSLVLIAAGAFAKSAQAPFHFWLPNAMSAPTPVSAYLHSATMVKAGVFLLARMHPALNELWLWTPLLTIVGGVTMVGAAWQATRETDLKRILAYSTVSSLGTMVFLLGLGHDSAIKAVVTFLLAHALYKGALFMIAGGVDHETGTRDLGKLGGLRKSMPLMALAAGLAAISMAGLPPAFGYLGKETLFAATLDADSFSVLLTIAALVAALLNFVVAGLVAIRPFFGPSKETPRKPHDGPISLWAPPLTLATAGIVIGALSHWIGTETIGPASASIAGEVIKTKLELWPGFGMILLLSVAAIGLGAIAYVGHAWIMKSRIELPVGGNAVFNVLNNGLLSESVRFTRAIQTGHMSRYIGVIILFSSALIFTAMFVGDAFRWPEDTLAIRVHEVVIAAGVLISAAMAAFTKSRLRAIAALGASGYGISMLFVIYGAPDLGMTQILVETLTVILLVSVFRFLPTSGTARSNRVRRRDTLIALAGGAAVSVIALAAVANQRLTSISDYFRENSKTEAQGQNVVNTILVDFRALDTLGEIAVLVVAAVGVIAMLRLRPGKRGAK